MKKHKVKKQFIEELERTPIIQVACDRVGISRNTFYRWMKEDVEFAFEVNEALDSGIDFVNDHAEGNVLNGIKKGDAGYTKYWLSSRHEAYRRPFIHREKTEKESKAEYEARVKEAQERLRRNQAKWFKKPDKKEDSTDQSSPTNRKKPNQ